MIEARIDRDKAEVKMKGMSPDVLGESILCVNALYNALLKAQYGDELSKIFTDALQQGVYKGRKEALEAIRKDKEQIDEANDFLRKFVDALNR
jgi:hypothetical protein